MTLGKRHALMALGGATLLAVVVWPAGAALNTVAGLFQAGRYQEAREALAAGDQGARPGEESLWESRLAADPAAAVTLLEAAVGDKRLSDAVRLRLAMELSDLQAGRGRHQEVLAALAPVLTAENGAAPGAAYLRAGLSLRALGRLQEAREMLASVRPDDAAFVLARYYLGDIALEQKDPVLAQRYFKAAADATDEQGRSRLAAGTWRAYRIAGEGERADALLRRLAEEDPGSLALLDIRRWQQLEQDERQARRGSAPADTTVPRPQSTVGRYALQLGAFSDRGLALEFVKRYRSRLPDLRIEKSRTARGQFLYRVRSGDFVNPALARAEARKLQQRLGIEVIATELAPGSGGADD